MVALLRILVLRQVLVPYATTAVSDMPDAIGIFEDRGLGRAGKRFLVESVRDQLADRKRHRPVLKYLLDIEVKRLLPGVNTRSTWTFCHERSMPLAADRSTVNGTHNDLLAPDSADPARAIQGCGTLAVLGTRALAALVRVWPEGPASGTLDGRSCIRSARNLRQ